MWHSWWLLRSFAIRGAGRSADAACGSSAAALAGGAAAVAAGGAAAGVSARGDAADIDPCLAGRHLAGGAGAAAYAPAAAAAGAPAAAVTAVAPAAADAQCAGSIRFAVAARTVANAVAEIRRVRERVGSRGQDVDSPGRTTGLAAGRRARGLSLTEGGGEGRTECRTADGRAAARRAERHVAETRSARGRTAGRRKGRSDAAEGPAGGPERHRRRRPRCDIAAVVAVCAPRRIVGSGTRSSTGYQTSVGGRRRLVRRR